MKPLLLVRHANPEVVKTVPARGWRLSAAGRARAHQLAQALEPYQPDEVVSSVESKALETAQVIAERLAVSVQTAVDLHEHDRSQTPFYTPEEFQSRMREFFARPTALVFGNETAGQALARFAAAMQAVFLSRAGRCVVVVTHGTVMSLFVSDLTGCDGFALWRRLSLPACAVLDVESRQLLDLITLQ